MQHKLIIVLSGQRLSGKSTLARFIFAEYLNFKVGTERFKLEKIGKDYLVVDSFNNKALLLEIPTDETKQLMKTYGVKIYSFEDPLKNICINLFGLDPIQCYGSEDDQNSQTHLLWDDLSTEIRRKYKRYKKRIKQFKPATGFMTGRDVMNVFCNDICKRFDSNCMARGLYNLIEQDGFALSIITDAMAPNEVTIGSEIGAKTIRLLKKTNFNDPRNELLDQFALGEFTMVVDNSHLTPQETFDKIKTKLNEWFNQYFKS